MTQPSRRLAVLALHKIGEPPAGGWQTWSYVPTARFAEWLTALGDAGWRPVSLAEALDGLHAPERLPERAALITFDDGYRSVLTEALLCLQRLGWPAAVFVPTAFIGGINDFDRDIEPQEAICDWEDLRELERQGVSVEAHGVSHRAFSSLGEAELVAELSVAKAILGSRLGKTVEALAYPYGDNRHPRLSGALLERLGYRAGFLYGGGPAALPAPGRFRLTRLALGPDSDLAAMLTEA